MFQKVLLTSAILVATSHLAFADVKPYVGGSLGTNGNTSRPSVTGNIFGGYGTTFGKNQRFYLGGEANANVTDYIKHHQRGTFGLGASLIPGIMLSKHTMLYGRAGATGLYNYNSTYSTSKVGVVPQLGVGLQTSITKNWDVRGEYVTSTMNSNTNQYNVGLLYKFN